MKWLVLCWLCLHFLLLSCELLPHDEGRIAHVGIALSYRGTDVQSLGAAVNDGVELKEAFTSLFDGRRFSSDLLVQYGEMDEHGMWRYEGGGTAALPTKARVVGRLESLVASLGFEDLLIITYSGHGLEDGSLVLAPDNDGGHIFLDGGGIDSSLLLSVDELFSILERSEASILLILDSCYSGNFVTEAGSSISLVPDHDLLADAYRRYFDNTSSYRRGVFVISATGSDHTSYEPLAGSHTHGYFTLALLEGLGWECSEQRLVTERPFISSDWLYTYILEHQKIPTESTESVWYQHPTISGGPLELVLVSR
ncbi:MAG TPA: caspase family protein [Sphaerochaeta sp.]|nr:caspase family protein [Sphaerochaeta sp.]